MTTFIFIIGAMFGATLGVIVMCIVIVAKQSDKDKPGKSDENKPGKPDKDKPGKPVGTVSPDLLDEWQACYNVEESLWDSTCEELGLDPDGGYEIDIETGVVMQNDPSG